MQDSIGVIVVSLLCLAGKSASQSCRTCRGATCLTEKQLDLECSQFIPALPFESQLMFNEVDDNAEYGCLNLEYYDSSDSTTSIQQCIISSNLKSYCSLIEESIEVKSCSVEGPDHLRIERAIKEEGDEAADEAADEDASESNTDDPVDEETTVKPSNGVVHLVSAVCFTSFILVLF